MEDPEVELCLNNIVHKINELEIRLTLIEESIRIYDEHLEG